MKLLDVPECTKKCSSKLKLMVIDEFLTEALYVSF